MSDIVEKLRAEETYRETGPIYSTERLEKTMNEAADEIERLRKHNELLQDKIDCEKSCACCYDSASAVCATHSPHIKRLRAVLKLAQEALADRRSYLSSWEWKYGRDWNAEDLEISKALERTNDK